jgi:hypothetical protein
MLLSAAVNAAIVCHRQPRHVVVAHVVAHDVVCRRRRRHDRRFHRYRCRYRYRFLVDRCM